MGKRNLNYVWSVQCALNIYYLGEDGVVDVVGDVGDVSDEMVDAESWAAKFWGLWGATFFLDTAWASLMRARAAATISGSSWLIKSSWVSCWSDILQISLISVIADLCCYAYKVQKTKAPVHTMNNEHEVIAYCGHFNALSNATNKAIFRGINPTFYDLQRLSL